MTKENPTSQLDKPYIYQAVTVSLDESNDLSRKLLSIGWIQRMDKYYLFFTIPFQNIPINKLKRLLDTSRMFCENLKGFNYLKPSFQTLSNHLSSENNFKNTKSLILFLFSPNWNRKKINDLFNYLSFQMEKY